MVDAGTGGRVRDSRVQVRVATYLRTWAAVGLMSGVLVSALIRSQVVAQSSSAQSPADQSRKTPNVRVFGSDAGLVLNFVKPDKTADFEAIMARLKEALQRSGNSERKQQAANWKVFRAVEPGGNGSVLYVFRLIPPSRVSITPFQRFLQRRFQLKCKRCTSNTRTLMPQVRIS